MRRRRTCRVCARNSRCAQQYAQVDWLEAEEVLELCPLMRPGVAAAAFVEPNALDLDANALLQGFARQVRRHGSRDSDERAGRAASRGNRTVGSSRPANTGSPAAPSSMPAARGATRSPSLCGVARRGLQPMRRTAATIGVPDELSALLSTHPFVAPVDNSYYFKPDAGAIMVSLSEEAPSEPCDAYADDLDVATALERFHEATIVPRARPIATWAGLRTFAPDRLPVVGLRAERAGLLLVRGAGRHRHPDLAGAFGARREAGPRASRSIRWRQRSPLHSAATGSCRRRPDGADAPHAYSQPRSRHPSRRRCRAGCRRRRGDIPRAWP